MATGTNGDCACTDRSGLVARGATSSWCPCRTAFMWGALHSCWIPSLVEGYMHRSTTRNVVVQRLQDDKGRIRCKRNGKLSACWCPWSCESAYREVARPRGHLCTDRQTPLPGTAALLPGPSPAGWLQLKDGAPSDVFAALPLNCLLLCVLATAWTGSIASAHYMLYCRQPVLHGPEAALHRVEEIFSRASILCVPGARLHMSSRTCLAAARVNDAEHT